MMTPNEIFILEDDPDVRRALETLLTRRNYRPVFLADGDSLLAAAKQKYPACIILDLQLPGKSGLQVLADLHEAGYPAPVFMMSGHGSIETAVKAAKLGVIQFFEKPFKPGDLIDSIEKVLAVEADRRPVHGRSEDVMACHPAMSDSFTPRERQILDRIARGDTTKDIARALGLSPRTVEDHRSNLLRKANVGTTAELLRATLAGSRRPKP